MLCFRDGEDGVKGGFGNVEGRGEMGKGCGMEGIGGGGTEGKA